MKSNVILQYTSGSARFPRGVMITQKTVMSNLSIMTRHGIKIRPEDRGMSWSLEISQTRYSQSLDDRIDKVINF
jgi:acyl-CoA synthetase (AMP-forming)/AMP-acid ligase II